MPTLRSQVLPSISVCLPGRTPSSLSSLHLLFPATADLRALREAGFMVRESVQFHWTNPGYADFDAFPDVDVLAGGIRAGMDELRALGADPAAG